MDAPKFADATSLGDSVGFTAVGGGIVCAAAGTWVAGVEIEAASDAAISLARCSRLSVISAHLCMGTDRAVSSGGCATAGVDEKCGEFFAVGELALREFGSAVTSECADGSTASIDLEASGKGPGCASRPGEYEGGSPPAGRAGG